MPTTRFWSIARPSLLQIAAARFQAETEPPQGAAGAHLGRGSAGAADPLFFDREFWRADERWDT
jgi:hypothetical protein